MRPPRHNHVIAPADAARLRDLLASAERGQINPPRFYRRYRNTPAGGIPPLMCEEEEEFEDDV